ncbi:MAG TPA: polyprenol monophosphomannose synthase [Vicinamibacterales bacterium]|nr:polyprenol monophosphomannose synthase [Vicinamibacterales bacterium]
MRPLVIVPTYNERENLPKLIQQLLAIGKLRVLIVDDGSPDGTGALADDLAARSNGRVSVLHRTGRRGLGRAYLDGIQEALATDADVICQMDADLSHRPEDLVAMLAAAEQSDVVIGSRYIPGGRIVNWPLRRRILSAGANRYIRLICSLAVRDCTSGFRCWRRETLAGLPLARINAEGYAFLVQLLWEAVRAGCAISEVPITFVERESGASKLRAAVLVESAVLPWRLAVSRAFIHSASEAAHRSAPSLVR